MEQARSNLKIILFFKSKFQYIIVNIISDSARSMCTRLQNVFIEDSVLVVVRLYIFM